MLIQLSNRWKSFSEEYLFTFDGPKGQVILKVMILYIRKIFAKMSWNLDKLFFWTQFVLFALKVNIVVDFIIKYLSKHLSFQYILEILHVTLYFLNIWGLWKTVVMKR